MERETGFEPATSTLARSHSTTELFPLAEPLKYHTPRSGSSRHYRKTLQRASRSTSAASSGDVGLM